MAGTLTISIEIELGWGVHDLNETTHLSKNGDKEREYLQKLLQKTEEYNIPITFDIVGHLLLSDCAGTHDGPYQKGWFDSDPGTGISDAPLFYAPDMATSVLSTETNHELCTHTFSHLLCGNASDELVDKELERAQKLHAEFDNRVSSFVPPRHQQPKNETLSRNGIQAARYAKADESLSKIHRFKELTIGPHPKWEPKIQDGILETYCTMYPSLTARSLPAGRRSSNLIFKPFPIELRKRAHLYYLRRTTWQAIESEVPLHLWTHLYDLSNRHQWDVLADYFDFLSTIPDEDLQVKTMESLADERHE